MGKQMERCVWCGEDTSAGSPLYSDRREDRRAAEPRYLCSLCARRIRGASREVHSDAERERLRRELEKGAFAFGSWAPGGH